MSRDHRKLRVFHNAHRLTLVIYRQTRNFPRDEWFGLRAQMRRAATSVPSNIVEGCARLTERASCNFCDTALGSACETRYLIEFSRKLEYFDDATFKMLHKQADAVVRSLSRLVGVLDQRRRDKRLAKWAKKSAALGESSDRRTAPSRRKNR